MLVLNVILQNSKFFFTQVTLAHCIAGVWQGASAHQLQECIINCSPCLCLFSMWFFKIQNSFSHKWHWLTVLQEYGRGPRHTRCRSALLIAAPGRTTPCFPGPCTDISPLPAGHCLHTQSHRHHGRHHHHAHYWHHKPHNHHHHAHNEDTQQPQFFAMKAWRNMTVGFNPGNLPGKRGVGQIRCWQK